LLARAFLRRHQLALCSLKDCRRVENSSDFCKAKIFIYQLYHIGLHNSNAIVGITKMPQDCFKQSLGKIYTDNIAKFKKFLQI